jgi:NAD-dependent SIR2 family protein deacetylase
MRTVVLLGAGASADAGLPLTNQLARQLRARFAAVPYRDDERAALNYVFGAMQSYGSKRGEDPDSVVDVEKLISAVRLLRDRADHEAAPFVQWERSVGALDVEDNNYSPATRIAGAIEEALRDGEDGNVDGEEIVEAIREVIDRRTGVGGNGDVYRKLERELREQLVRMLYTTGPVDYLEPLVHLAQTQRGGLDVVTLNYDLTVERAATKLGVKPERAINKWTPGSDLAFPAVDGALNLIKLHGSIDWVNDVIRTADAALPQRITRTRSSEDRHLGEDRTDGPAIVIGHREKLETEGATLTLFRAFEAALRRADRLVIVGYSGGDAHVNAEVRDWVNADATRTITVLDPGWPVKRHDAHFAEELNNHLGQAEDAAEAPRLRIVRATTAQGLTLALTTMPEPAPQRWFTTSTAFRGEWLDFTLTAGDRDLSSIEFHPNRIEEAASEDPRVQIVFDYEYVLTLPWLAPRSSATVSLKYQDAADAVTGWRVRVDAIAHLSSIQEESGAEAD